MVGAGQLARMTQQAAIALGQSLRVLAADPGDPAALVCPDVHAGAATDLAAMRAFARGCSAVTFDHEQVPQEHLRALVAAGVPVHPGPDAMLYAQDKLVMRRRLAALEVAIPAFAEVADAADLERFGAEHGWPLVLKAARGGYDGRGVWKLDGPAPDLVATLLAAGTPLLVEPAVPMRRELAALVARSPYGQAAAWPVVETVQEDGQCVQVLAPAPGLDDEVAAGAQRLALRLAAELGVTGLLAVELFERTDGALLVNELAMRPHNSGHWTIEGSRTSQFEQHLRAVLDYPLGTTTATAPAVVMANVLGAARAPAMTMDERVHHLFARFPDVKVHLYGKAERPARKVGHVTALGADMTEVRRRAALAAEWLSTAEWPDGWSPHTGAAASGPGEREVQHA
jgi:5-(carboxyamino)imidazole ribonucleotide synthase